MHGDQTEREVAMSKGDNTIPCECRIGCACEDSPGPAVFLIKRDGREMQVCGRCDYPDDKIVRRLNVDRVLVKTLMEHDPLSTFLLLCGSYNERSESNDKGK